MSTIGERIESKMTSFPTLHPKAFKALRITAIVIAIIGALGVGLVCLPTIGGAIFSVVSLAHIPPIYLVIGGGLTFAFCHICKKMKDKKDLMEKPID